MRSSCGEHSLSASSVGLLLRRGPDAVGRGPPRVILELQHILTIVAVTVVTVAVHEHHGVAVRLLGPPALGRFLAVLRLCAGQVAAGFQDM